jgi:hypothetical protein
MSTPELSGSWIYRSYNPTYVLGAAPEREDSLILTDADLNLEHPTRPTTLEGTIEWPGRSGEKEGLVLQGWVLPAPRTARTARAAQGSAGAAAGSGRARCAAPRI